MSAETPNKTHKAFLAGDGYLDFHATMEIIAKLKGDWAK